LIISTDDGETAAQRRCHQRPKEVIEMIGRKATLGLSLLSALLICAFAAQSAFAIEALTSKNTTAVTCVKEGGLRDFSKEHCDAGDTVPAGTGKFGHVEFKGETKEIAGTNEKVTEETKKLESAVFRWSVPGGKSEFTCEIVKFKVDESNLSNTEPELGKHTLSGTIVIEFSKCTVKAPLNCTIAEPLIFRTTIHGVEGMEGPKKEPNAMGIEFIGEGEEETLAELEYKGEKCSLKGLKFKLKGKMVATSGPTTESSQENKEGGATWVFTPKFKMQTLKFGANEAELETILTPSMNGGNPISTTTT
jgi:hypothetical protein